MITTFNGLKLTGSLYSRLVDDLPASVVFSSDNEFWYEDTHPLGFIDANNNAVLYNHVLLFAVFSPRSPSRSSTTETPIAAIA